jgi:hypothetical protein
MSGQMRWLRDVDGTVHPDDGILLAYIRKQSLGKGWLSIHHHVDVCKKCRQHCDEYKHIGEGLTEALGYFQQNQYYPPLAEGVFELIQNPSAAHLARRRRKRYLTRGTILSLRLAPIIILLLLLLFVAIVLAKGGPSLFGVHTITGQMQKETSSTVTILAHLTPTVTVMPKSSLTATPGMSQPAIKLCTTKFDRILFRVHVCGFNFTPGDKVELMAQITGGGFRARHLVIVDAQGTFQDFWTVNSCKDDPTAIFAKDLAHNSGVAAELQNDQWGLCSSQFHF